MQSNLSEFCGAFACYSVIKLQENGIKAVSLLSKMTHLHSKKKWKYCNRLCEKKMARSTLQCKFNRWRKKFKGSSIFEKKGWEKLQNSPILSKTHIWRFKMFEEMYVCERSMLTPTHPQILSWKNKTQYQFET